MNKPDIQYFEEDGTWIKPPGAGRVTVVLKGGDGGEEMSTAHLGRQLSPNGYVLASGNPGEVAARSYAAADLPELVPVEVGKGGRPGGRDGYALIVTHLSTGGQR